MFLPFIAFHSFRESTDRNAGLRAGALVGAFRDGGWSLNVGVNLDLLNFDQSSAGSRYETGQVLGVAFSPLFHARSRGGEFVVGPKLGGWIERIHFSFPGSPENAAISGNQLTEGWTMGGNAGVFFPVSPRVRMGALMTVEFRGLLHCPATTGQPLRCASGDNSATIMGFGFGAML